MSFMFLGPAVDILQPPPGVLPICRGIRKFFNLCGGTVGPGNVLNYT